MGKQGAADDWNKKYDPFGLNTTSKTATPVAGYMGNTLEMQNALAKNNIAMQNNGQKTAVSITKPNGLSEDAKRAQITSLTGDQAQYLKTGSVVAPTTKPKTPGDVYSGGGYGTAGFNPSQTYLDAMAYTNSLLEQLSSGRTSYSDRINALMDQISNREAFSYDMDNDTLFQNSLQSAMQKGQIAMQDTMGQAASLTGGYGSTYATSAANQAYNGFIQDAYANLPDYYNIALEAYNMEGQNMYNQLGMYQTADDVEYSRLANAYQANMANASSIYDKEYNNYWQTQNFNQSARNQAESNALKAQQMQIENARYNAEQAEDKRRWEAEYQLAVDKANSSGNATKLADPSNAQMQTALGLYNRYGDAPGSEYEQYIMNLMNNGVDVDQLDAYIIANGDKRELTTKRKYGIDTTKDQWGNEVYLDEDGNYYFKTKDANGNPIKVRI